MLASSPALAPSRSPAPAATSSKPSPSSSKAQDIWDFDSLPSSTSNVKNNNPANSKTQITTQSSKPQQSSQRQPQTQPQSKPKPKSQDPFDFDSFEDPGDSQGSALGGEDFEDELDFLGEGHKSQSKSQAKNSRQSSVGEDDILGALAAPAQPQTKNNRLTSNGSSSSSRVPSPADGSRSQLQSRRGPGSNVASSKQRSTSPPPHIVGQLVEMGFGPVEARKALSQTDSGIDVQAAAEILVGNAAGGSGRDRRNQNREDDEERSEGSEEERDRQLAWELQREEEERGKQTRRFGNGTEGRDSSNQGRGGRRPAQAPRREDSRDGDETSTPDWQKQADQLYNQAQEIGTSVFNKANAFWSSAKAQAQKALEERAAASQNSGGESGRSSPATAGSERARSRRWGTSSNSRADRTKEWEGKPRWMVEAEEAEGKAAAAAVESQGSSQTPSGDTAGGGFKDSDEEQDQAQPSQKAPARKQADSKLPPRRTPTEEPQPQKSQDLWDLPPESSSSKPRASPSSANGPPSRKVQPSSRSPQPSVPKVSRVLISEDQTDSASFISKVSQLKISGNECFKKGSYGEAEQFYSKALEILPEKSLRRIPLLNNRSNSRLKNGDSRNAIRDSSEILSIILPNSDVNSKSLIYNPNSDSDLPRHLLLEVNLRDSWSKALLRKAQAEEILEKWVSARSSWLSLERFEKEFGSGKSGVQNMRSSRDGISRCEKMMSGGGKDSSANSNVGGPSSSTSSNLKAKSAAASRASKSAAEAVRRAEAAGRERVRAENAAADAEDAAKFALKDKVDERINEWKKGKENNVRALVASVDSMTWAELNWKKIGMHELITDVQVKKGYTRAIAKLHPDKVSFRTEMVEQKAELLLLMRD